MKPDVEKLLAEAMPRGPSAALREKILDAVRRELQAKVAGPIRAVKPRSNRWERRIGWASVISLSLAIALNVGAYNVGDARLASFQNSAYEPAYIVEAVKTIEAVTDAETADWYRRQLLANWRANRPTAEELRQHYERIQEQLTLIEKELCHAYIQKDPQMDGNSNRVLDGDTSYHQRHSRLAIGCTA